MYKEKAVGVGSEACLTKKGARESTGLLFVYAEGDGSNTSV